jgi:plastocyanin
VLALLLPAGADAASRKVAIGGFAWSVRDVTIDRGDAVTWFWVGPDTQHSVTGLSENALALDSDPGDGAPDHAPGDRFTLTFDQPGTYAFHCKLHAIVRGSVTVTDTPGTGAPSPDPDPEVAVDYAPPELTDARFVGTELRYTLDEPARITLDVMRGRRLVRTRRFGGHVGWNRYALSTRGLKRGRYRVLLVAADAGNNHTRDVAVPLRIIR